MAKQWQGKQIRYLWSDPWPPRYAQLFITNDWSEILLCDFIAKAKGVVD